MAKSVLKKKRTNRRLKKSVRRTLGALCMITAIIVAAIPFPDAAAESAGSGVATAASTTTPYMYDTDYATGGYSNCAPSVMTDIEIAGVSLDVTYEKTGTAYTISKPSSGNWQMDWQFEYHAQSNGADGYITKYNNQYQVDEISLNYRVYSDYINIPETQVSNYYAPLDATQEKTTVEVKAGDNIKIAAKEIYNLGHVYELSGDPLTCPDHDFFTTYFNDLYTKYKQQYDDAKLYETKPDVTEEEKLRHPYPETIKKTYKDVYPSDTQQVQFFCDQVFGVGTDLYLQIVDQRTYDAEGVATGWAKVYVPRLNDMSVVKDTDTITIGGTPYYVDANGFLADKFASLIGIAKEAFKGVSNVKTLEMAREISFIGNSAFEDSFLQSVTLSMDAKIGNRAFKNCSRLTNVTMPSGVQQIGTEAFAGTSITAVDIPDTVTLIGGGAFYNCGQLKTVVFSGTNSANKEIRNFAFYDCLALDSVDFGTARVNKIGDCAFAVSKVVTGGLAEFKMPDYIESGDDIGAYLFGGRTNLQNVTMPSNLGTSVSSSLPATMFYNCVNLASVTFPETCYSISYPANLFNDVMTESFYVRGPKTTNNGADAEPRKSTWVAYFAGTEQKQVPYVYTENGEDFYEVSNGEYLCVIDKNGMLISCKFVGAATDIDEFIIPEKVGTTTITGIADGCLGSGTNENDVLGRIQNLIVEEGNMITTIDDGAFANAQKLETVTLGDSVTSVGNGSFANCPLLEAVAIGSGVTSIGAGAFENCESLEEIAFDNPAGGAGAFPLSNIGERAFSTNGDQLTIYGMIDGTYGPFAWAMQPNNYMKQSTGLRVCYKSAKDDPQGMTVILDNSNNLATLIDYPKYDDIKSLTGATPEEAAKIDAAVNIVVPNGVQSIDTVGYFNSNSKDVNGYNPVYKSNATNISTYFSDTNVDLESQNGLFLGATKNTSTGKIPAKIEDLYKVDDRSKLKDDTDDLTNYDIIDAGNDHIESIVLTSVEYLPENAFFSCERLETVDLGSAMKEMDALPFLDCNSLTSMACTSGNFSCNNGILYENLSDGTKKIVECLPGRGNVVGSTTVSVANDPDLANVSEIEDEAFSYCPNINKMILTGASKVRNIPERCFVGTESLNEVDLPENVKMIQEDAFSTGGDYLEVIVRGREVALVDPSFQGVKSAYLITYEDAAIRESAREQGVNVETTLDEMLEVRFYMPDGSTLIDTQFVELNGNAKKMAPDEEELREQGYITEEQELYGWSGQMDITKITEPCFFIAKIGLKDGVDTNGDGIPDTPKPDDGTGDGNGGTGNGGTGNGGTGGNGGSGGNDSVSGNKPSDDDSSSTPKYTLTVVYGDGSGVYKAGSTVIISAIEPPAGKEFYKWTTTNTGVTITSATSAATTVKTTNSDAVVTATYRDKSTVSGNTVNRKPIGSSGSTVQISKPGISNTDKAYASVSGSTDNFIIKITESAEAANAVATALSNKYFDMNPIKYFAMDISLYDKSGNKVTNTNGLSVNVTMPIPDALVQYGGNNKVGAVVNGNTLEELRCKFTTVDGIPCVTFTATHFSPYTIYVDTSNLSVNTLDSTPKTGDGIHPKWFVSIALACISLILFMKRDKVTVPKKIAV